MKINLKKELDCNFVDSDKEEEEEDDNNLSYDEDIPKNVRDELKPEVRYNK